MSQLKIKLQKLLPELRGEAKSLKCREAKQRYRDLKYVVYSKQNVGVACKLRLISRDYFEKWAGRVLEVRSLKALQARSRAPKKQPLRTSKYLERKILELRKEKPFLGAERLHHELNVRKSWRTVHRILKRNGVISKKRSRSLTKRHTKRYRQPFPGYLQMDFKYVPYEISGKQYYQLSCIDHHSSWRFIRVYPTKCRQVVKKFLDELIETCPFWIMQIQTDNDVAFTNKFVANPSLAATIHPLNVWRDEYSVEHKLIPVGEKELNGKVENSHKQDDREFFSQVRAVDYESLKQATQVYEYNWNFERTTKALGWKTPIEVLEEARKRAWFWLTLQKSKYNPEKKKIKRKSQVNRYLTWLEEDAKKYNSWPIYLPLMFRQSSEQKRASAIEGENFSNLLKNLSFQNILWKINHLLSKRSLWKTTTHIVYSLDTYFGFLVLQGPIVFIMGKPFLGLFIFSPLDYLVSAG